MSKMQAAKCSKASAMQKDFLVLRGKILAWDSRWHGVPRGRAARNIRPPGRRRYFESCAWQITGI